MKAIKRIIITLLSATMLLTATAASCSAASDKTEDAGITVTVNGQTVAFPDQKPIIRDDRTLVPIRFIAESLGYEVDWDPKENIAVIDGGRIKLWIGTNRAELDGKAVTLDTSSILVNDRTMVPLRVVAETLDCTVDWLAKTNTVQITAGTDTSVWERLNASGLFTMSNDAESGYKGCIVYADSFDTTKVPAWYVKQDTNMMEYCADEYDCEIYVTKFDAATLAEIREALMIIYPTGYDKVYDLMMKSIKAELWESLRDNAGYLASGTFGTHYIDGREVNIYVKYGLSNMTITVNKLGYVNPETPLKLDAETIADMTKEAKNYYPLAKYGLDG